MSDLQKGFETLYTFVVYDNSPVTHISTSSLNIEVNVLLLYCIELVLQRHCKCKNIVDSITKSQLSSKQGLIDFTAIIPMTAKNIP